MKRDVKRKANQLHQDSRRAKQQPNSSQTAAKQQPNNPNNTTQCTESQTRNQDKKQQEKKPKVSYSGSHNQYMRKHSKTRHRGHHLRSRAGASKNALEQNGTYLSKKSFCHITSLQCYFAHPEQSGC